MLKKQIEPTTDLYNGSTYILQDCRSVTGLDTQCPYHNVCTVAQMRMNVVVGGKEWEKK